jgi:hypothetical protein
MAMSETINLVKLKREEQRSQRFYLLLLLSPFITAPWAILGLSSLSYYASPNMRLIAASVPGLFFALLLFGWLSPHLYVRRHMLQALLLAGLRVASGALFLGFLESDFLWFLSNGSLWLFCSTWGWNQVVRGDCWLMRQLGEGKQLPRPWAEAPTEVIDTLGKAQKALTTGKFLIECKEPKQAVAPLLTAFGTGAPDVRQQALARLETIGEVELF